MRRLLVILATIAIAAVAVLGGAYALVESGEVVLLRTANKRGKVIETRLWIVDHEGVSWLTPGRADRGWLRRLRTTPRVELVRGEQTQCYDAAVIDDPSMREKLGLAVQEKYRLPLLGARILNAVFAGSGERSSSIVRLDPCPTATPANVAVLHEP